MSKLKQFWDAVEDGRVDAAQGIYDQSLAILEMERETLERYTSADVETLKKMSDNGDDRATAFYAHKRIQSGDLDASDVNRLDAAVDNLCRDAAFIGAIVHDCKNSRYEDRARALFCYAVMEQYGDAEAHKKLAKAYKREWRDVDAADIKVLKTAVGIELAKNMRDRHPACEAEVYAADKSYPEYKKARTVTMRFFGNKGEREEEDVYVSYQRGKDRRGEDERLAGRLREVLISVGAKSGIKDAVFLTSTDRIVLVGDDSRRYERRKEDKIIKQEEIEANIRVAKNDVLHGNICKFCGGALDENGVCKFCGRKNEHIDHAEVVITESDTVVALTCTQCGAPVTLDSNGKTAFCSSCGTTFLIKGNALTGAVIGLDFESLKADKPKDAPLPSVRFMRARIMNEKVSAILPQSFITMPDDIRRIKYPINPPQYIYTTPDSTVNLCFSEGVPLHSERLFLFGEQMLGALKQLQPSAMFGKVHKKEGEKPLFWFDFITQAADQGIYNAMFFFVREGKQITGSWNCLAKDRWFWAPVFELAVKTMEY